MGPQIVIVHVEDDDLKARAVARVLRTLAPEVAVVRVRTLEEYKATPRPDGILTDWHFPADARSAKAPNGSAVVQDALAKGLPVLVLSGGAQVDAFAAVWSDPACWVDDLRTFVQQFDSRCFRG